MEKEDKRDEFIRKMVRQIGPEKAPDNFTNKIMGRIGSRPLSDETPLLSPGTWIIIISGLAAMIVLIFMVDLPFLDKLFSSSGIQKVSMNIFSEGFFKTMSAFFKGLNISSITWMIIAAAAGLVLLERLLRRRFSETRLLII